MRLRFYLTTIKTIHNYDNIVSCIMHIVAIAAGEHARQGVTVDVYFILGKDSVTRDKRV